MPFLVWGVCYAGGYRFNHSYSMPYGWYKELEPKSSYEVGNMVAICPPLAEWQRRYLDPGSCPSGLEPMLKTIAAVPGDVVTVESDGISVNGTALKNTAPLAVDGARRPLVPYPAGTYTVQPGQVWVLVSLRTSFDSRYLGPIATSDIQGSARPTRLTWR